MNRIFFPLRSNAGWFANTNLTDRIEQHLKRSILLFDEIILEDGGLVVVVGQRGKGHIDFPPGSRPDHERKIKVIIGPNGGGGVQIAFTPNDGSYQTQTIDYGPSQRLISIDYYEIFQKHRLGQYDFIKKWYMVDKHFSAECKAIMRAETQKDKKSLAKIFDNQFEVDALSEHINRDIMSSLILDSPLVVDPEYSDILRMKSQRSNSAPVFSTIPEEAVFRRIVETFCPDFAQLNVEQVVELRNLTSWTDFRRQISEVASEARADPDRLKNEDQFGEFVSKQISASLLYELEKQRMNKMKLGIDLAMGAFSALPGVGLVSSAAGAGMSVHKYINDQMNWSAFLSSIRDRSS